MFGKYRRIQQQRAAGEIDQGFTLIELLIVIVVLGILAAVVIFALGGITGKSAQASCAADGATVSTAEAAFVAQNPNYSDTAAGTGLAVTTASLTNTALGGPYIQSWPSNLPHYAFQLTAKGVLQVSTGATFTSTSPVVASDWTLPAGNGSGNLGPAPAIPPGTAVTAPWYNYIGPLSCTHVT
jgi:general secretion pathway protein G